VRDGDSSWQGEESKVKSTKTSGGRVNASLSYNRPRDCNISSFLIFNFCTIFLLIKRKC